MLSCAVPQAPSVPVRPADASRRPSRGLRAASVVAALVTLLLGGLVPAASADTVSRDPAAVSRSSIRAAVPGAAFRAAVVSKGLTLRGVPYRYGGSSPRGFDCSGFTGYVFRSLGRSLPRTAAGQRAVAQRVSRASAMPGDLVFFSSGGYVYHVGIYVGGNRILHASRPGYPVSVQPIWSSSVSFGRV